MIYQPCVEDLKEKNDMSILAGSTYLTKDFPCSIT